MKETGSDQKTHRDTSLCHPSLVHTARLCSADKHTLSLPAAAKERQEVVECKTMYLVSYSLV